MKADQSFPVVRRHLLFGWWSLAVFVLLGTTLEALLAFKASFYLDVGEDTRRMLWRLAHAHGAVLGLAHVAFAFTVPRMARPDGALRRLASPCLIGASIALPGGFFLGGLDPHGGDPGPGVVLAPLGALLLIVAVVATAVGLAGSGEPSAPSGGG